MNVKVPAAAAPPSVALRPEVTSTVWLVPVTSSFVGLIVTIAPTTVMVIGTSTPSTFNEMVDVVAVVAFTDLLNVATTEAFKENQRMIDEWIALEAEILKKPVGNKKEIKK